MALTANAHLKPAVDIPCTVPLLLPPNSRHNKPHFKIHVCSQQCSTENKMRLNVWKMTQDKPQWVKAASCLHMCPPNYTPPTHRQTHASLHPNSGRHRHTSKVQKCVKHNMLIPVACSFNLSASAFATPCRRPPRPLPPCSLGAAHLAYT